MAPLPARPDKHAKTLTNLRSVVSCTCYFIASHAKVVSCYESCLQDGRGALDARVRLQLLRAVLAFQQLCPSLFCLSSKELRHACDRHMSTSWAILVGPLFAGTGVSTAKGLRQAEVERLQSVPICSSHHRRADWGGSISQDW